jgi:cytochrome c oxidase cbb3-type subunit I
MAENNDFKHLDELIDKRLIRLWLYWGMFWLLITPSLGVTLSTMFNYPGFLGTSLELGFGRLRPMHVNGVIFGAFSTLFIGLCYYIVPRLCGVRMVGERLGYGLAWGWNIILIVGLLSLLFGFNQGFEAGEFPWFIDVLLLASIATLCAQFIMTVARRVEAQLYVSLWYLLAAFIWTVFNFVLIVALLPYFIWGLNSAAFHGLFIHYIVGLWITPAGYVLIYYFLPASVKNPLYSHKLSLVGFWSLALFYPFVGIHHYLFSPIANWAETIAIITSMLLIIPVWVVLQNFFGTMIGRWREFSTNLTAKFLILGAVMYLFGCFQGSVEALRSMQVPTHFTDFVISHSHLTVFGTFVVWAIAGLIYVWPRITGRPLWSFKMANWSFWLIAIGISLMGLSLSAQGLQHGFMLMAGTEWLDALRAIAPYWLVRTVAGLSMDIGMTLLVINLMLTVLSRASTAQAAAGAQRPVTA